MRKVFNFLLLTMIISPAFFILGCEGDKNAQKTEKVDDLSELYQNYVSYAEKTGSQTKSYNEFISFVENKGEPSGKVNRSSDIIDSGEQIIQAQNVENCQNGKSAYELALENGFNGTIEEWLSSLKGGNGQDGLNGTNGQNGKDGQNGIGIMNTTINNEGHLIITFSNGDTKDCGNVVGANGVNGKDGENGKDGQQGAQGIKGETGDKGDKGDQGEQGEKGKDGQTGAGIEKIEKVGSNGNIDTYEIILTNGQKYPFTITNAREDIIQTEQIDDGATQKLHYIYNKYKTFYQVAGIGLASDMEIVISANYMGKEVLSITENAFCNITYITSVIINNGIQIIEDYAFYKCFSLNEVTIPLSVARISICAFDKCDNLSAINIQISEKEYKTYSTIEQVIQDTEHFTVDDGLIVRK